MVYGDSDSQDSVEAARLNQPQLSSTQKKAGLSTQLPRFNVSRNQAVGNSEFANQMARLRRSFTPSQPISQPELFAGRRDLLQRLIHLIEDQLLHVVVYGDRGIGKTSLLNIISSLASEANYHVVYASCGSDTTFSSLARNWINGVPLLFHSGYEPTDDAVEKGGVFSDLLDGSEITVADVTALLEQVESTRLLLIVDEFDRVGSEETRAKLAELIKNLSDRGAPIQILIAGVASNLASLVSHIPSIRRNLIGMPMTPMNNDEVTELLSSASSRAQIRYDKGAETSLIRISRGLPYLAQLIALHASILMFQENRETITKGDIDKAALLATEELALRVSASAMRKVEQLADKFGWQTLCDIAEKAMINIGQLTDMDLKGTDSEVIEALLEHTDYDAENSGEKYWTFREEASMPFIWLKTVTGQLVNRGGHSPVSLSQ